MGPGGTRLGLKPGTNGSDFRDEGHGKKLISDGVVPKAPIT